MAVDIAQVVVNNTEYNFADDTKVPYDLLQDTVGWTSKNLIPFPYYDGYSKTNNGVTYIVNSDGTIALNGTATGRSGFNLVQANKFKLSKGKYILSGCPSGGADGTYSLFINFGNISSAMFRDVGNGVEFTLNEDSVIQYSFEIIIRQNVITNNLIFKPMLRKADIMDSTYEQYNPSVKQILRNNKIIEGKNLLENEISSTTINGITLTVNADKSVTLNGTATETVFFYIKRFTQADSYLMNVGEVILSGTPLESNSNEVYLSLRYGDGNRNVSKPNGATVVDFGNGVNFDFSKLTELNTGTAITNISDLRMILRVGSGQTVSNRTFKPMIRKATETDPSYEQYYIPGVVSQEAQNVLGAKNLIPYPWINHTDYIKEGITYTDNGDGTFTANGTSTNYSYFVNNKPFTTDQLKKIAGKKVILSGGFDASKRVYLRYKQSSGDAWTNFIDNTGNGIEFTFPLGIYTYNNVEIVLEISTGQTVSNLVFMPMLRLAEIQDSTYVPYAMTNRELTEIVQDLLSRVEALEF